jgi:hypothetical protein
VSLEVSLSSQIPFTGPLTWQHEHFPLKFFTLRMRFLRGKSPFLQLYDASPTESWLLPVMPQFQLQQCQASTIEMTYQESH